MTEEIIVARLEVDEKPLQRGLKNADKKINKTAQLLKKLGGFLAVAFSARAIKNWAQETARWANELDKVAREMDLTVRGAQQLAFFTDATGISMANMRDAAFEIKKRFGEIGENERFRNTVKALGITKEQAAGLNNAQLMFTTLERISRLPLEEQEIALDQAFGGGAAKELNQLVKDREFFLKALETAGGVRGISGDSQGFKQLQLQTALVRANFKAVSAELLLKVLPTVTRIFEWLVKNSDEIVSWAVAVKDFALKFLPGFVLAQKFGELAGLIFVKWESIKETIMVVRDTFVDIFDTLRNIWTLVSNPIDTANALGKGIFNSIKQSLGIGDDSIPLTRQQGLPAPASGVSPFFASGQGPLRQDITQNFVVQGQTAEQLQSFARREAARQSRRSR